MEAGQLFVYGTLQHPEVMRQVVGRLPHARKAVARDCARRRLKDRCYPGMFFSPGETTPGLVYESITNAEWLRLDAYEGEIYHRVPVRVDFEDGTPPPLVAAYILGPPGRALVEEQPWSYEDFVRNDLRTYLSEA